MKTVMPYKFDNELETQKISSMGKPFREHN